jgi:cell division protein FtsQ
VSRPEPLRRRSDQRVTALRPTLLAATVLIALVAIAVGVWREAANPRFAVQLTGVTGLEHTSAQDVVAAANLPAGQNVWLINRAAVAQRIQGLPWVDRATLHVGWPNRLTIAVTERRPAALVALGAVGDVAPQATPGAGFAVIDETGRVLVTGVGERPTDLPVLIVVPPPVQVQPATQIDRPDIAAALDAYRRLSALGLHVSEVALAPSTGMSATADRNLRVLFGEDEDLAKKAELFQAIVAKISTPSRVAYVDVRSVRAPTVLYR